jgi:hypothetical protein
VSSHKLDRMIVKVRRSYPRASWEYLEKKAEKKLARRRLLNHHF